MDETLTPPNSADSKWWTMWFGCAVIGPLLAGAVTPVGEMGWVVGLIGMIGVTAGAVQATVKLTQSKSTGMGCLFLAGSLVLMLAIFFFGCASNLRLG